jgi:hypothetical protein
MNDHQLSHPNIPEHPVAADNDTRTEATTGSEHSGEIDLSAREDTALAADSSGGRKPGLELRFRAIAAAHHCYHMDPQAFRRRHTAWDRWADHANAARELAVALGVPAETVTAGHDPIRRYGPGRRYPGRLFTVTESRPAESRPAESEPADSEPAESEPAESEPADAGPGDPMRPGERRWRFIPDLASEYSWLLLDDCPACEAPAVPVARIACMADLGDYLDPPAGDDFEHLPYDFGIDPGHHPDCPAYLGDQVGAETSASHPARAGRVVIATWRPNAGIWVTRVLGPTGQPLPITRRPFTSDRALRRYASSLRAPLRYEATSPTSTAEPPTP